MHKSRFAFSRSASLRAAPITQLLLIGTLAVGIGAVGHAFHKSGSASFANAVQQTGHVLAQTASVQGLTAARADMAAVIDPALNVKPENVAQEVELDDGQTFADLLSDSGASDADATAAMNALSKVYDLRKMQAGQDVTLSFLRTAQNETLTGAVFQPEATKEVVVTRDAKGDFTAAMKMIPVVRQRIAAQGEIHSSLYEAGDRAKVPHAIMASLIRIFSHDIDFQRDIHSGDRFEVLYDQPTTAQGKAVGEGDVIYAALNVNGKVHPIYRVMFSDKTIDYFDDKGQSIRRAILRTPVAAAHITSGFGMRMHPLLGYSKMHKGVDFGAAIGTPIFAAGTGTVADIGFKNGYGRYIRIKHSGTLATAYAHMSRFASNLYQGAHVNQGEVIGYVGMSGRATGPHLHFEVHVNGVQVNPMSVNLPTGRSLDGALLASFRQGQTRIRQEYASILARKPLPDAPAGTAPAAPAGASSTGLVQASASGPAFAGHQDPSAVAAAVKP